jgi:integrase
MPTKRIGRPRRTTPRWTTVQQKLLSVLEQPEHRDKSLAEICQLAGYGEWAWERAIKDDHFVRALLPFKLRFLDPPRGRPTFEHHLNVTLADNPEEELAKDVWDMRRLLPEYPRHRGANAFIVDFTCLPNLRVRAQVKQYFRSRLLHWKAGTFRSTLTVLRHPLRCLPPEGDLASLTRAQVEGMLASLAQCSRNTAQKGLYALRAMLEYMSTSPTWSGPRPERMLIWTEDIPATPKPLPRPVPPDVLEQLEDLLHQAVMAMEAGTPPPLLCARDWDAILILRRTGMRFEDLAHLKAPDHLGHHGCLMQDSEGYWWIRIEATYTKMGREHRIPTKESDGVIAAIRRQQARVRSLPNHFREHYLFRTQRGLLSCAALSTSLKKLAPSLLHAGQPYAITPHQFRHSLATDMIEQGVDIYTVKEFLGHRSLVMTERYVKVYLRSLKTKYDAYRTAQEPAAEVRQMAEQTQRTAPAGEADGGWVEHKVGTLYRSPLPDGIGWCEHLAMLDPCPTPPHCPTCPKLRATRRHLPVWETKVTHLLITVESLRDNPLYARARQKHEQELAHASRVVTTIQQEGVWDGRIHNTLLKTNRPVQAQRASEVGAETSGDL